MNFKSSDGEMETYDVLAEGQTTKGDNGSISGSLDLSYVENLADTVSVTAASNLKTYNYITLEISMPTFSIPSNAETFLHYLDISAMVNGEQVGFTVN